MVSNVHCNPAFIVAPTHLCCYGSAGFLSGWEGGGGGLLPLEYAENSQFKPL